MERVTIERADNGYILRYDDPAVQAENRKEDTQWTDPEVRRVYADEASMVQDLTTLLPALQTDRKPADEFSTAFNEASSE